MQNRNNVWVNIDWITVSIYLAMMFIGWINIYAAVYNEEHKSIFDFSQQYGKQLIWILAAIFIAVLMINTDSKFFVAFSMPIYIIIIIILILVPFIGTEINGAKSWIQIGNFSLQPSEFMKMATSLAIARYISSYTFKMHNFKSLLTLSAIILVPVALIFLQNDTGSAIVFGVFLLVLYREGLNGIVLFFTFLIALVFILTMVVDSHITIWILTLAGFLVYYLLRRKTKMTLIGMGIFGTIYFIFWLINYLLQSTIDPLYFIMTSAVLSSGFFYLYSLVLRKKNLAILIGIYAGSVLFRFRLITSLRTSWNSINATGSTNYLAFSLICMVQDTMSINQKLPLARVDFSERALYRVLKPNSILCLNKVPILSSAQLARNGDFWERLWSLAFLWGYLCA